MISRRRFSGFCAALTAASVAGCASPSRAPTSAGAANSVPPLKQIDAGALNIGYAELGPADGPPVILLHGWPYDVHSYVDMTPPLVSSGYRVIVPYLRGFGTTTFLSCNALRNAQQSAVATDVIALMDALHIPKAIIGGFDWGSRTAAVVAALWPGRCKALVAVSGYLITNPAAQMRPLPPAAESAWWYQYYFSTERGLVGYRDTRREFTKLIWRNASPKWNFDDPTFERTAASFDNPDHVDIVIHNYRWRLGLADGDRQYDHLEQQLATGPSITVAAITVASDFDGAAAGGESYRSKFTGPYSHRIFAGIGHNVPQEAPQKFAEAIVDADHL